MLSSYFHRIFYNTDDLFIFKKQFTTYHGVNSFFAYLFKQAENASLSQISFCKNSGRLFCAEAKLVSALSGPEPQVPFRLTSNIVEFMGQTGILGLFPAVITACSLAISKQKNKLAPFLAILLKEELPEGSKTEELVIGLLDRIEELSSNYEPIQVQGDFKSHMRPPVYQEFNKKVFQLIEQATDEERLKKMPIGWAAWF